MSRGWDPEIMAHRGTVIFVGSLPLDIREREIEDLFYKVTALFNFVVWFGAI